MKKTRWTKLLAGLLACAVTVSAVAGCGSTEKEGTAANVTASAGTAGATTEAAGSTTEAAGTTAAATGEKIVRTVISYPAEIDKMDTLYNQNDLLNYELIYEPLVRYGEGGAYEPGLAESWDISENGLEYTFHLRKDVKFSDGSDFNADNVLFNVARWADQASTANMNTYLNLEQTEKIDDHTVKFIFSKNYYPYLTELTYSRPLRFLAESSLDADGNFVKPIGTGPWMVESYDDTTTTLVPNPYYRGEAPKIDKLVTTYVADSESRIMALQSGEIDITYCSISSQSLPVIEADENLAVYEVEGTTGILLSFNYDNEILKDVNVRKAFNYAINKEEIVNDLFDGKGTPATGMFPTTVAYVTEENNKGYEYDLDKAKELLASSGYTDSDGDGILDKNGMAMDFDLIVTDQDKSLAEYLQAMLQQIGISVKIREVDNPTYSDTIGNTRNFDLCIRSTYPDVWNPVGTFTYEFYKTENSIPSIWTSDEFNQLFEAALATLTEEDRQAKYDAIYEYLYEEAAVAPIYYPKTLYAYHKNLTGIKPAPSSDKAFQWEVMDIAQ